MRLGLIERLRSLGPFASLGEQDIAALMASATLVTAEAGRRLIGQEDASRDYFVVIEGELEARREWSDEEGWHSMPLGRVGPGEGVGEMALLTALPRSASVYACTRARVLRIDGPLMDDLLSWCSALGERLAADAETRKRRSAVRQTPVFRHLPLPTMQCAFERMRPVDVAAGEVVVRQGEPGDSYYLVESGRVAIRRDGPGGEGQSLGELGPGGAFGEEALLTGGCRNATVVAVEPSRLWRLDKADFEASVKAALVEELSAAEALRLVAAGEARWLDCRTEEEHRDLHIPGSLLLPLHRIRDRAAALPDDTTLVVYCRNGARSTCAAFLLRERGLRAVALAGGLQDWLFETTARAPS